MEYEALRKRMVADQLIPRGISDKRVLDAFLKVERQKFLPVALRNSAYDDHPIPIGENQTISQPFIVALMTQTLNLTGNERILEIGTGSGYQAAILGELAKEVFSIERIESLSKTAEQTLRELNYTNIKFKIGDGTLGWKEESPFDCIIITAASPRVPLPLTEQLKKDGGKLILPLGESFSQMLTLVERQEDGLNYTSICPCVFVPLIGKHGYKA
ncbi:MAG: protein-L-isoaspartate(D-aspartate) O-methyltransferase [Candidatus Omnitrophica bacterium]|nr:protein-L-isoaspartate(D-aspartate) O-methyltransferase [Candidatus Omnitrophota bacterium]